MGDVAARLQAFRKTMNYPEVFSLRGIELISVRDGKVALKDVYWKRNI